MKTKELILQSERNRKRLIEIIYKAKAGHENGVLGRDGHTEALLDLTRMAGLTPGGALIEILNQDGTMARLPQLLEIAEKFQLKIIAIKDIQEYRRNNKI